MKKKRLHTTIISGFLLALSLILAACAPAVQTQVAVQPVTLTVMTHDSFAATDSVVAGFEAAKNLKIQFLKAGDAGTALNKAILARGKPLADAFYGVDNTLLSKALGEDLFEPYASPALAEIDPQYRLDDQNRLLPVDYGDVCLNYDKAYFTKNNLNPPQNLDDLLEPEYKSLLVVENPAISSPGLAFLFTTISQYGDPGYLDYWQKLAANDLKIVNDWESAYYTEFSAHGGSRPVVVSYGSSPPAEVVFAETPIKEPPTAVVTTDGACFRQVEFVGLLKGAQHPDLAKQWIDFMLSPMFQEDMPLQMFVYPANLKAKLPKVFTDFAVIPAKTAALTPDQINAGRDKWIQAWTEQILH